MARLLSYVLVFVLGFTACAMVIHWLPPYQGGHLPAPAAASLASYPAPPPRLPGGGRYTVADAIVRVQPAVVNILTEGRSSGRPTWEELWLRRWFGRPLPQRDEIPVHGVASGVIVSSDGYVLTNNHMV